MTDVVVCLIVVMFFFKQKTAYELRISVWSSDVCSSDLTPSHLRACRCVLDWRTECSRCAGCHGLPDRLAGHEHRRRNGFWPPWRYLGTHHRRTDDWLELVDRADVHCRGVRSRGGGGGIGARRQVATNPLSCTKVKLITADAGRV